VRPAAQRPVVGRRRSRTTAGKLFQVLLFRPSPTPEHCTVIPRHLCLERLVFDQTRRPSRSRRTLHRHMPPLTVTPVSTEPTRFTSPGQCLSDFRHVFPHLIGHITVPSYFSAKRLGLRTRATEQPKSSLCGAAPRPAAVEHRRIMLLARFVRLAAAPGSPNRALQLTPSSDADSRRRELLGLTFGVSPWSPLRDPSARRS
jgi:hypothetical protein